jgi:hypothetical protein
MNQNIETVVEAMRTRGGVAETLIFEGAREKRCINAFRCESLPVSEAEDVYQTFAPLLVGEEAMLFLYLRPRPQRSLEAAIAALHETRGGGETFPHDIWLAFAVDLEFQLFLLSKFGATEGRMDLQKQMLDCGNVLRRIATQTKFVIDLIGEGGVRVRFRQKLGAKGVREFIDAIVEYQEEYERSELSKAQLERWIVRGQSVFL